MYGYKNKLAIEYIFKPQTFDLNMDFEDVKKRYGVLAKKYALPSFKDVSEQFELEKIDVDSDCFARIIRKTMMDKVVNSLGFLEMLLNPVNAPRIYLHFIKNMNMDDKRIIEKAYDIFGELSLTCLALELSYSEKKEADMIKRIFKEWEGIRPDFIELMNRIAKPHNSTIKKEKSYFG